MKYLVSTNGLNISVGLLDLETAEQDINLSHNLLNTNAGDHYYCGVIHFSSIKEFFRFLINKYYLVYWVPGDSFSMILRRAANKTRQVLNEEAKYQNFVPQIDRTRNSVGQVYRITTK
tara:strand:- start:556 stop:909 length:354 start_codon:yes stop_codon:yes gene_type:complete